ncbi:hypothetical protein AB0M95_13750 [Sphaerisporangium sp. NPDC051017]|uniref:hypothetical protein n=1 Tax=Sphaerisporangium sp. NPDC051017 TaxID=3154636 RepID=UPI00341A247B
MPYYWTLPRLLPKPDTALEAADRLQRALGAFAISADVNVGSGIALVSVWADLIVWTHGELGYWWWSGRYAAPGRKLYAWGPVRDPVSVARRVAFRFAEACQNHPRSAAIVEMLATVRDGWEIPPLTGQAVLRKDEARGPGDRPSIAGPA